jgi:hypothetical protein
MALGRSWIDDSDYDLTQECVIPSMWGIFDPEAPSKAREISSSGDVGYYSFWAQELLVLFELGLLLASRYLQWHVSFRDILIESIILDQAPSADFLDRKLIGAVRPQYYLRPLSDHRVNRNVWHAPKH